MKKIPFIILLLGWAQLVSAHHIIGGEMFYKYISQTGNMVKYTVTLKLYRGCEPVDQDHSDLDPSVVFTIIDKTKSIFYKLSSTIPLSKRQQVSQAYNDPCIVNPPQACYQIGYYTTTIEVPVNDAGYVVAFQRCCRFDLLTNANTRADVGATYYTELPGRDDGIIGTSSPQFSKEEAISICANSKFTYDYTVTGVATGDSVDYSFTKAFAGGSRGNVAPVPTSNPPFPSLSYISPYSPEQPMGDKVSIDPHTGVISGIAPAAGTYVIAVTATVYRNGKAIIEHRKDFHITVTDCHRQVTASIPDKFNNCQSYKIDFTNSSTTGKDLIWYFGDGDTSHVYAPSHQYKDTGIYLVKLKVDPTSNCGDSATTEVRVYPVLNPAISVLGSCIVNPTQFKDISTNDIGNIDSWHWDFGDNSSAADTANIANPSYKYPAAGTYTALLKVSTDKGCEDTVSRIISVYNKPDIYAATDTMLCIKDSIHLPASSSVPGTYSWLPAYNIINTSSDSPIVYPKQDTTYQVSFTDNSGCNNTANVKVQVKSVIKVNAGADTTLCSGDPLMLNASSDGNYVYMWYDNNKAIGTGRSLEDDSVQTGTYKVIANLQSCIAQDEKLVKVVPLPKADAGADTSICYGDKITLHASGGSAYRWNPPDSLNDPSSANPLADPLQTTVYNVFVSDTLGCPKTVTASKIINVIPPVNAFAGNDTIITLGQVFQLHASGGTHYTWSPSEGLDDPYIADPMVSNNRNVNYALKVATDEGCFGYDTINVKYIKGPAIYVPNAFSPNNDGINDVFRPIPVGIVKMKYFRIYNRWGGEVFSTTDYMRGWNGNSHGSKADAGTYVWMVEGQDYNGKTITKKGTVILIR